MRGGSRPGAGRPRIYGKRVQLSILISEETKAKLKELAEVCDKPLACIVERLIINEHASLTESS
jgi:predicted transcriptional regulator